MAMVSRTQCLVWFIILQVTLTCVTSEQEQCAIVYFSVEPSVVVDKSPVQVSCTSSKSMTSTDCPNLIINQDGVDLTCTSSDFCGCNTTNCYKTMEVFLAPDVSDSVFQCFASGLNSVAAMSEKKTVGHQVSLNPPTNLSTATNNGTHISISWNRPSDARSGLALFYVVHMNQTNHSSLIEQTELTTIVVSTEQFSPCEPSVISVAAKADTLEAESDPIFVTVYAAPLKFGHEQLRKNARKVANGDARVTIFIKVDDDEFNCLGRKPTNANIIAIGTFGKTFFYTLVVEQRNAVDGQREHVVGPATLAGDDIYTVILDLINDGGLTKQPGFELTTFDVIGIDIGNGSDPFTCHYMEDSLAEGCKIRLSSTRDVFEQSETRFQGAKTTDISFTNVPVGLYEVLVADIDVNRIPVHWALRLPHMKLFFPMQTPATSTPYPSPCDCELTKTHLVAAAVVPTLAFIVAVVFLVLYCYYVHRVKCCICFLKKSQDEGTIANLENGNNMESDATNGNGVTNMAVTVNNVVPVSATCTVDERTSPVTNRESECLVASEAIPGIYHGKTNKELSSNSVQDGETRREIGDLPYERTTHSDADATSSLTLGPVPSSGSSSRCLKNLPTAQLSTSLQSQPVPVSTSNEEYQVDALAEQSQAPSHFETGKRKSAPNSLRPLPVQSAGRSTSGRDDSLGCSLSNLKPMPLVYPTNDSQETDL